MASPVLTAPSTPAAPPPSTSQIIPQWKLRLYQTLSSAVLPALLACGATLMSWRDQLKDAGVKFETLTEAVHKQESKLEKIEERIGGLGQKVAALEAVVDAKRWRRE